eukprot:g81092.t1
MIKSGGAAMQEQAVEHADENSLEKLLEDDADIERMMKGQCHGVCLEKRRCEVTTNCPGLLSGAVRLQILYTTKDLHLPVTLPSESTIVISPKYLRP